MFELEAYYNATYSFLLLNHLWRDTLFGLCGSSLSKIYFPLIDHINKSVMKNLKNMIFTMFAFTDLIDSTVIQNGTI